MVRLYARVVFFIGCAGTAWSQDGASGPASFWQREIASHRALADSSAPRRLTRAALATRLATLEPAAKPAEVAAPAARLAEAAAPAPIAVHETSTATAAITAGTAGTASGTDRPTVAERVATLRGKIQGTEARLLYSTAPEERALSYNAERRAEMRQARTRLEREGVEHRELLDELSGDYRALPAKAERQRWMKDHKPLVVQRIAGFLDARRRGAAVDAGLADLDATDERLRRLIEAKRSDESDHGRERAEAPIEESVRIELPVPAPIAPEPDLTPEELELLQELFPAR